MFQKKVLDFYLSHFDKSVFEEKYALYSSIFLNKSKQDNIRNSKEEQYQEGFLRDLFVSVLGYTIKPESDYNLFTEAKNDVKNRSNSKKADGAICEANNENNIKCVIELKGTSTRDLDLVAFQAFSYKNFHTDCKYVVVSNFEKLRFYTEVQSDFEAFDLFNLSFDRFCVLYVLLEVNQLMNDMPLKIKNESLSEEKQITDDFYGVYSTFKRLLFEDLKENNPEIDKLLLFKKMQKLLDRILFIRFCSDRGLLPTNSVLNIIKRWQTSKENFIDVPLYSLFKQYFNWIDKGFDNQKDRNNSIFAYNGGLFKSDDVLDSIKVGDDVLYIHCNKLAQYNFESQISVDILGRIFENSLTEIEEIEKEIEAEKQGVKVSNDNKGKRKKDGVFYTPEYITRYIVENTIGVLCNEKRQELGINADIYSEEKKYTEAKVVELEERLTDYRNWLFSLKILDCACGSGAFLNAALRQLRNEHRIIDIYFDAIHKTWTLNFDTIENDNSILEKNLYGVDINEESIEITKLSLWLNTAKRNRKLATLNNNIKVGNSLIDNPNFEKTFDWKKEFPEVFENGGFDVVIGNPPYFNIQTFGAHNEQVKEIKNKYADIWQDKSDILFYFFNKALDLSKNMIGFITSNAFLFSDKAQKLRNKMLKDNRLERIVNFEELMIFKDAGITTCISLFRENHKPFSAITLKGKDYTESEVYSYIANENNSYAVNLKANDVFALVNSNIETLNKKIDGNHKKLNELFKIGKGMETASNGVFCFHSLPDFPKEYIKKRMCGENIDKYRLTPCEEYILYFENVDNFEDLPKQIKKHLEENESLLLNRATVKNEGREWWRYARPLHKEYYNLNKIWCSYRSKSNKFVFDGTNDYIGLTNTTVIFDTNKKLSLKYLLALLNSSTLDYRYKSIGKQTGNGVYEYFENGVGKLPIPEISLEQQKPFIEYADKMLSLNEDLQKKINRFIGRIKETYSLEKTTQGMESFYKLPFADFVKELSKQKVKLSMRQKDELEDYFNEYVNDISALNETIEKTDREINALVYSLYGLSEEEIGIIEKS